MGLVQTHQTTPWLKCTFLEPVLHCRHLTDFCSSCPDQVMRESVSELTQRPAEGCYIHGLFLEGARWDPSTFELVESRPKELYTEMAIIWLIPVPNRKPPTTGIYLCPIYKTLTRAGKDSSGGSSPEAAPVRICC